MNNEFRIQHTLHCLNAWDERENKDGVLFKRFHLIS